MIELPEPNISQEEHYIYHSNLFYKDVIKSVAIFICSSDLTGTFYNFSDFFLINKINDDEIKLRIKDMVISSLKQKQYSLAYVFNKTGLVICKNDQDLDNSVWKSNLDFTKI